MRNDFEPIPSLVVGGGVERAFTTVVAEMATQPSATEHNQNLVETPAVVLVASTKEGDVLDISLSVPRVGHPYTKECLMLRDVLADCVRTYSKDGQSATFYLLVTCNLRSFDSPLR